MSFMSFKGFAVILLALFALCVLVIVGIGIVFLVRLFLEKRNRKIMAEKYLPMIKDEKVRAMIEGYPPADQRALALAYLCFGSKGSMPKNEAEEQLAELASSLEFAAESDIPGYVDNLLKQMNHHRLSVYFNMKKEFHYKMKVR